jgi:hypothetical protein
MEFKSHVRANSVVFEKSEQLVCPTTSDFATSVPRYSRVGFKPPNDAVVSVAEDFTVA